MNIFQYSVTEVNEWICNLLCSSNLGNNICIPIHRQASKQDFPEWKGWPKTTLEWETYITYTNVPIINQKKHLDHQVATSSKFFKMKCCWPQNKSSIPVVDQEIGQLFDPENSVFHSVSHIKYFVFILLFCKVRTSDKSKYRIKVLHWMILTAASLKTDFTSV